MINLNSVLEIRKFLIVSKYFCLSGPLLLGVVLAYSNYQNQLVLYCIDGGSSLEKLSVGIFHKKLDLPTGIDLNTKIYIFKKKKILNFHL